jgi:hypothetical protein
MLSVDGSPFCFSLEDAVREVPGEPVEKWKVYGKTAIPSGRYRVTLETSDRFGPDTLTINGVPGFKSIRMHSGNTEIDTDGCPLLGYSVNADGTIAFGTTKTAVRDLKAKVKTAIAAGAEVWITIKRLGVPAEPVRA